MSGKQQSGKQQSGSEQAARDLWAGAALREAGVPVPLEDLRELVALARYGPEAAGLQPYPAGSPAAELLDRADRLIGQALASLALLARKDSGQAREVTGLWAFVSRSVLLSPAAARAAPLSTTSRAPLP